jgi:hypothetical protein
MLPSLQVVSGYFSHLPLLGLAEHAAIPAGSEHHILAPASASEIAEISFLSDSMFIGLTILIFCQGAHHSSHPHNFAALSL